MVWYSACLLVLKAGVWGLASEFSLSGGGGGGGCGGDTPPSGDPELLLRPPVNRNPNSWSRTNGAHASPWGLVQTATTHFWPLGGELRCLMAGPLPATQPPPPEQPPPIPFLLVPRLPRTESGAAFVALWARGAAHALIPCALPRESPPTKVLLERAEHLRTKQPPPPLKDKRERIICGC